MKKILIILSFLLVLSSSSYAQSLQLGHSNSEKKTIIKIKPASPTFYHAAGGIEQTINDRYSFILSGGYIGGGFKGFAGWKIDGYHISAGPRLYFNLNHFLSKWNGAFYINPEVNYSKYAIGQSYIDTPDKQTDFESSSVLLSIGRQEIFRGFLTVDFSGGIGYGTRKAGWESYKGYKDFYTSDQYFSHAFVSSESPITYHIDFSVGINLGGKIQTKPLQTEMLRKITIYRPRNNYSLAIANGYSLLSLNYERLFIHKSGNFLAAQIGAGITPCVVFCSSELSANAQVTANIGGSKHFLEVGTGANIGYTSAAFATIGYRYQPIRERKMNFRVFANVALMDQEVIPVGISIGRTF